MIFDKHRRRLYAEPGVNENRCQYGALMRTPVALAAAQEDTDAATTSVLRKSVASSSATSLRLSATTADL
jgi:hypothetical protein